MIRAEDPGTTVVWVLVQAVNAGLGDFAVAIPHQEIVQHQPWQSVKGVPPLG